MPVQTPVQHVGALVPIFDESEILNRPVSQGRLVVERFWKNKAAVGSLIVLVLMALIAVLAPAITRYNPIYFNVTHFVVDGPPGPSHWLGTDAIGRDVFSRIVYGMRPPLAVGFFGAALCTILGGLIGAVAGYFGGWIDEILMRFTEFIFVVPGILLIILGVAFFGEALDATFGLTGRLVMITLFLATDSWPVIMRLTRAEAMRMRSAEFVEAALVAGTTQWQIVRRHVLANVWGILMVQGSFLVSSFVFTLAVLTILGIGTLPPLPDISQMILDAPQVFYVNVPEAVIPSVLVVIMILAPTFVGDGLRDAFDVRG
ncbi:MAG: ABC transporter permease [Chloroflexota bacterium]